MIMALKIIQNNKIYLKRFNEKSINMYKKCMEKMHNLEYD